jgi:putative transposase
LVPINAFALTNHYNAVKPNEIPRWDQVSKHCFESAFADLAQGFTNWFKRPDHFGRPDFHARGKCEENCRLRQGVSVSGHKVKIPTIGKVRYKEDMFILPQGEEVLSISLKKVAGHYYATLRMEKLVDIKPLPHPDEVVYKGADSGIKSALVVRDGEKTEFIQAPRPLKWRMRKLKRAQRAVSRKVKGSKNRDKAKAKVARIQHLTGRQRRSFQHQTSKLQTLPVAGKPVIMGVEDCAWKNMMANHRLAQALADVGISGTITLMGYKANKYGGLMIKIDRFFPSTKMCSGCGHVKAKMELSERTYHCDECGLTLDRDDNAARNIRAEAMRIYRELYYSRADGLPPSRREAAQWLSKDCGEPKQSAKAASASRCGRNGAQRSSKSRKNELTISRIPDAILVS